MQECTIVHMWSEDNFVKLALFPHLCEFWGQNQVIRIAQQAIDTPIHLAGLLFFQKHHLSRYGGVLSVEAGVSLFGCHLGL